MDIKKLVFLVGLPGSGKTKFAEELCKRDKKAFHLDVDRLYDCNVERALIDLGRQYLYFKNVVVVDGLLLTTSDICRCIKTIQTLRGYTSFLEEIEIHRWYPNREQCKKNDFGRRDTSSTVIIELAQMDDIDTESIKDVIGDHVSISLQHHMVYEVDNAFAVCKKHNVSLKEEYIKSSEWSLGGTYGNCWGDELGIIYAENPCDFVELDNLLEKICPNITFMQYKKLYSELVETEERSENDYYGGCETISYYKVRTEDLMKYLQEQGLLEKLVEEE